MKIKVCLSIFLILLSSCAYAATIPPTWTPIEGEYYPTDPKKFPTKIENPNPQVRELAFTGKPQDIFTKLNMVTQIQIPEPPVMINIGNPEAYVIDVAPEFSSIFVKPVRETDMTNLIVTTERGTYIFILKENPYKPFDVLVRFGNPHRARTEENTHADMIAMAVSGKRLPSYQHVAMDIRTPNTTAYVHDAVLGIGAMVRLQRVVATSNLTVYHLKLINQVQGVSADKLSDYVFDEKSVAARNLKGTAVADGSPGLIKVGEAQDVFIFTGEQPSPRFQFRFALRGNRSVPVEVDISTVGGTHVKETAVETVNDRLQRLYLEAEAKRSIPSGPATPNAPKETPKVPTGASERVASDASTDASDGIVIFQK